MPRASFSVEEETAALKDLEKRAGGFVPTGEERELIGRLEELHDVESAEQGPENQAELLKKIDSFKAAAGRLSGTDEERYLLLGDFLAFEFDQAFKELLEEIRARSQSENRGRESIGLERIKRLGGSFFDRCMARGAISVDGRFLASRIAAEVLFRARWRVLGELRLESGLNSVEKRAYYDFVAAFASSQSEDQRLAAVRELGVLDKNYDAVIAEALIYHQSGNDAHAYKLLKKAVGSGRNDGAVRNFLNAVKQ